jgi:dihydrofolate reductase
MRKVKFSGANSLDNLFARKDGTVDWLLSNKQITEFMKTYWETIDTMVMGRRTYEVSQRMGAGDGSPGIKTYVFSRTLKKAGKNIELISEDVGAFVRRLKQQKKGKDIFVMGGGLLAKSLFEADLIDEISFCVHPVLLGSGIPVFHEMSRQIDLKLISCQELSNGCVMLSYRVKHQRKK